MKIRSVVDNPRERERFLKFAVVGAVGALVDFGSFHLLMNLLGIEANWAQAGSFTFAIISNFIWNRVWTYPDSRSKPISSQLMSFFIINLVGLGIRTPIFNGLEEPFRNLFANFKFLPIWIIDADSLGYTFALGVAVVVVMFWNFLINRIWTYNDVE